MKLRKYKRNHNVCNAGAMAHELSSTYKTGYRGRNLLLLFSDAPLVCNKFSLTRFFRKYITVFLLLCLIFTLNIVPISAVTASGGTDYDTTNKSTFPITVGFGYRILPGDGYSPTMVFSNEFGGFGQEFQSADRGQDFYTFSYPAAVGEEYNLSGKGVYYYDYMDSTTTAYSVSYTDGSYNSQYRFGYQHMRLHNSAFIADPYDPTKNFMNNAYDTQQCITFTAKDVYYNTHYLYGLDNVYYTDPRQAMLPCILMPNNDNMAGYENDNAYYVYHYTYEVSFIDAYGQYHDFSGGWYHNTRDDPQKFMSLIPLNVMQSVAGFGHCIIIHEFDATLSATLYERPTSNVINGTWQIKVPSHSQALFGIDHVSPVYTAACNTVSNSGIGQGLAFSAIYYYNTTLNSNVIGSFLTNGAWDDDTLLFSSVTSPTDIYEEEYFGDTLFTISDWDYANNNNQQWYTRLTNNYDQIEKGAPDPSAGSAAYVEKGLAGEGLVCDLYYPLYNGEKVAYTGTAKYWEYYDYFGLPSAYKYVREYGTRNDTPDDIPVIEGMNFTSWLVGAVGGFVGFELWEGFSLANILSVCIAIPLVLWILKLFAGG